MTTPADQWGPWIEHDGFTPSIPYNVRVQFIYIGSGLVPADGEEVYCAAYPGFFWRWRTIRAGIFRTEKRRVCDDPAYAPIIRYRIRKPIGLTILESLLTSLPEEVEA